MPQRASAPHPTKSVRVRLADFKENAKRLLPHGHPLLTILKNVPDEIDAVELDHRLDDWISLLEA
jgi:hypothetical protein